MLLFAFWSMAVSLAQPNIVLPQVGVKQGNDFEAALKAYDFTDIVGIQFSIHWNPGVIEFKGISEFNLPEMNDPFGLSKVDSGLLTFLWITPDITNGVTLGSGEAVFTIEFSAIGAIGDTSSMVITDSPTMIFVLNSAGQSIGLTSDPGQIIIQDPDLSLFDVTPRMGFSLRPTLVRTELTLVIDSDHAFGGDIYVFDIAGKVIHHHQLIAYSGETQVLIETGNRSQWRPGHYIVVLETDFGRLADRFVIVNY